MSAREHAGFDARNVITEFDDAGEVAGETLAVDFDFDEVYRRCDGEQPAETSMASMAFDAMMSWLAAPIITNLGTRQLTWQSDKLIGYKMSIYRFYTNPDKTGQTTLTGLAKSLGISRQKLSVVWLDFRDTFKVSATWAKSDTAREASRQSHRLAA